MDAATMSGTTGPQETVAYYPFGQTRIDAGTTTLDYKCTGKEYDPEVSSGGAVLRTDFTITGPGTTIR